MIAIAENKKFITIAELKNMGYSYYKISKLEEQGREKDYVCGFEESYGYLTGTYVRDKDAVNAAFIICERKIQDEKKKHHKSPYQFDAACFRGVHFFGCSARVGGDG